VASPMSRKMVASGHNKIGGLMPVIFNSRGLDKFILRFPDGMRDRIAEAAKANNRSMNAEVVSRLQDSFEKGEIGTGGSSPDAVARTLDKRLKKLEGILDKRLAAIERKVGSVR
jgi:hypothetical protein